MREIQSNGYTPSVAVKTSQASRASKQLTTQLDRTQVAARRWAMNEVGQKVAAEFVLGEQGWSTFEAREAQSKIRYLTRVNAMEASRWPRMVLSMMASENIHRVVAHPDFRE